MLSGRSGMNRTFWKGKRILVTGHTGFKGSWLSLWLQLLGADVLGYALPPPTNTSMYEIARVADGMTSVIGDIRDLEHIKTTIADYRPEIVFHLAAQPLVRHSYKDPVETYSTNVMGTVSLLESIRNSATTRVVVNITTDKCYENKGWVWGYRENDSLGGHDPYSSSKACAELVISSYRRSYFSPEAYDQHRVAIASARAGNVVGGGDWARDRLIPDIMIAVMENRTPVIRSPSATRPWQFVLEPLHGYISLAERLWAHGPQFAQAWNFGPNNDESKPVSWIAEFLTQLWGDGASWTLDLVQHPYEENHLTLDSSKAESLLAWSTKISLSTTLDWIVEWYRAYKQNEDMHHLSKVQITRYENLGDKHDLQRDPVKERVYH